MGEESLKSEDGEITNSGIKAEGSWNQICDFSRDVEKRFEEVSDSVESVKEYSDWRPRKEEDSGDIQRKTAEKASMDKLKVEEDFQGAETEIKNAVEEIRYDSSVLDGSVSFFRRVGRILSTGVVGAVRWIEREIYSRIMLKFNPYYFDTSEFSVNIKQKGDRYVMKVNILEDDMRDRIQRPARDEN